LQQHRARQLELRRQFGPDYRADLDLICCQSDGSPYKPDSVSSLTWNLKERLLLPKGTSLHALRHARASYALEDGASIATVSEMLGHASPATTMGIYAHSIKGADKAAAEAFEQRRRRVLASVSEMSVN
jgi:integrase